MELAIRQTAADSHEGSTFIRIGRLPSAAGGAGGLTWEEVE